MYMMLVSLVLVSVLLHIKLLDGNGQHVKLTWEGVFDSYHWFLDELLLSNHCFCHSSPSTDLLAHNQKARKTNSLCSF